MRRAGAYASALLVRGVVLACVAALALDGDDRFLLLFCL